MGRYLVTDAASEGGIPTINLSNLACASPWAWGANAAAAPATTPTPATSIWLQPALTIGYNLTDKAKDVFRGVFADPPSAAFIRFGYPGKGNSGITIEGVVTLEVASWNSHSEESRILLLAHEHTHLPQWELLGHVAFLARYLIEYQRSDNYVVPPALAATPISALEATKFCDTKYTMDQMAERTGHEAVKVAKAKGYIP
jgi:hypothetical protein